MTSSDPEEVMPPRDKAKRPQADEIAKLQLWIRSGAPWNPHWAYRSIARPEPPVQAASHPVDRFIRARLRAEGISASPEADRVTLIRRVFYDLLGLPPSPEAVDQFLRDTAPGAFERLVDRTLASPHFGERWGRHWLDQARYADSDGYEKDSPRLDAWRYRDWVIDAVNRDLPLDRFTIEQLAGDLLPNATPEQILATAFHRQTLTNKEGGVDQEQYRIEAVFDRTETTGSVWLGHTVTCARCHTHKYDPLTHQEYYGLFAFFNNAEETNTRVGTSTSALARFEQENAAHLAELRNLEKRVTTARAALADRFDGWESETAQRIAALTGRIAEALPLVEETVTARSGMPFIHQPDGSWQTNGVQAAQDVYVIRAKLPPQLVSGFRLEVLPSPELPGQGPGRGSGGNFVLSEFEVRLRPNESLRALHSPKADHSQKDWDIVAAVDGLPNTGWGIGGATGKAHHATFHLMQPIDGAAHPEISISLQQLYPQGNHAIGRFRILALVGETVESIAPSEVRRLVAIGSDKWTADGQKTITDWWARLDPEASALTSALSRLEASGPRPPLMEVRVLTERPQPRATRVLHRGEFLSPTEPALPGTPAVLPPLHARAGVRADRLDLAEWLVSPENPLPSRVLANQIWRHLFGEGIVRTPGDFGVRGDRPSHPELLDWLACELQASGWSRKHLIRLIMTSETYRQSSDTIPDLLDRDPRNLLLARQNRVRAEGEIVRDLHLAASGLIAPKIGGPSVFPPMPPEVASVSYANNFKWIDSPGEDRYRRGMYTFFKRTAPYPDLMIFDCPDANVSSIQRNVSNTPLQALTTLNARTFTEAAVALAKRVVQLPAASDTSRLVNAFRLSLTREPNSREISALLNLLGDARIYYSNHEEEASRLGGDPETAAWTATTRILLNTDEFITRR